MKATSETITFNDWKNRFKAGDDVSTLALSELRLINGLEYGRVTVESRQGSLLVLAHFLVDSECEVRTFADFKNPDLSKVSTVEGAHRPEGPVVGLFLPDDEIKKDSRFTIQYFDPNANRVRGSILLNEVAHITIAPYPGGFSQAILPDLISARPELVADVFAHSA